jgi:hypothetical protein
MVEAADSARVKEREGWMVCSSLDYWSYWSRGATCPLFDSRNNTVFSISQFMI